MLLIPFELFVKSHVSPQEKFWHICVYEICKQVKGTLVEEGIWCLATDIKGNLYTLLPSTFK